MVRGGHRCVVKAAQVYGKRRTQVMFRDGQGGAIRGGQGGAIRGGFRCIVECGPQCVIRGRHRCAVKAGTGV
jgi:hypothetical protein